MHCTKACQFLATDLQIWQILGFVHSVDLPLKYYHWHNDHGSCDFVTSHKLAVRVLSLAQ